VTTGEQRQTTKAGFEEVGSTQAWTPRAMAADDLSIDDPVADERESIDVTTMLQLSLFLMLLTFFLVLTTNTSFDERRVGPVIGGIQSAFGVLRGGVSDNAGEGEAAALPVLQVGAQPATGAYASDIEAAFASVGAARPEVGAVSFDMVVDASRLFVQGAAAVKADQRALFQEIAPLLFGDGDRRHLAILVPEMPALRLDVRRAASLARVLLADGAPASQIAVGVRETSDSFVTFRFYIVPGDEK